MGTGLDHAFTVHFDEINMCDMCDACLYCMKCIHDDLYMEH